MPAANRFYWRDAAVASIFRDLESLEAEVLMEHAAAA
jgi:hypothetical protein